MISSGVDSVTECIGEFKADQVLLTETTINSVLSKPNCDLNNKAFNEKYQDALIKLRSNYENVPEQNSNFHQDSETKQCVNPSDRYFGMGMEPESYNVLDKDFSSHSYHQQVTKVLKSNVKRSNNNDPSETSLDENVISYTEPNLESISTKLNKTGFHDEGPMDNPHGGSGSTDSSCEKKEYNMSEQNVNNNSPQNEGSMDNFYSEVSSFDSSCEKEHFISDEEENMSELSCQNIDIHQDSTNQYIDKSSFDDSFQNEGSMEKPYDEVGSIVSSCETEDYISQHKISQDIETKLCVKTSDSDLRDATESFSNKSNSNTNLYEKLFKKVCESNFLPDSVSKFFDSNVDMTNNDFSEPLLDENITVSSDVVSKSEEVDSCYENKFLCLKGKPDISKWIKSEVEHEDLYKRETPFLQPNEDPLKPSKSASCNKVISPSIMAKKGFWLQDSVKKSFGSNLEISYNDFYETLMDENAISCKETAAPDLVPESEVEKESSFYEKQIVCLKGKPDFSKWILPKSEGKNEGSYQKEKPFHHSKDSVHKIKSDPELEKENICYKKKILCLKEEPDLSKWISPKLDVENEDSYEKETTCLKEKSYILKSYTPEPCNKMISSSIKFYPKHTNLSVYEYKNSDEQGLEFNSSLTDINEKASFSKEGSKKLAKANLSKSNLSFTSSCEESSTPDVVPDSMNDHDYISPKFLQLPKPREDLINSYKANMDKVIETGTNLIRSSYHKENVGKVLESSRNMIKSYKEPDDKVLESGFNIYKESASNMISTYKESGSKMINTYKESGSNMINTYKESGSNIINTYKESGSDMIQQPVKRVLESSSDVLSSNVTSITNSFMNIPAIGKYLPWLSDSEEHED